MKCQRCDGPEGVVSYVSGSFFWNAVCRACRDQMKLEDWNHDCKPDHGPLDRGRPLTIGLEKRNAINQDR